MTRWIRVVLGVVCLCSWWSVVSANSTDVDKIPNGTRFGCMNCHYPSNQFQADYKSEGRIWTLDLAQIDSDGDGYTNGEELQDPEGHWHPGMPNPGDPDRVTNPGDPNSHPGMTTPTAPPTATATPAPSSTPTPPATQTPPATATPETCTRTGVTIEMPSHLFHPGDLCFCKAEVCNAEGKPLESYPVFVILQVLDQFYFAPGFTTAPDNYLDEYPVLPPGTTEIVVIPEFRWPDNAGTFSGAVWYGAITNPEVTAIVGDFDAFTFGWTGM